MGSKVGQNGLEREDIGVAYRAELLDVAEALYVTLASMKRPETVTCNYLAQIAFRPPGPRLRLRFFGGRGL